MLCWHNEKVQHRWTATDAVTVLATSQPHNIHYLPMLYTVIFLLLTSYMLVELPSSLEIYLPYNIFQNLHKTGVRKIISAPFMHNVEKKYISKYTSRLSF
jgi:hypothetical protein